jgi:hypothetical protein
VLRPISTLSGSCNGQVYASGLGWSRDLGPAALVGHDHMAKFVDIAPV